jgi:hypothetical protein
MTETTTIRRMPNLRAIIDGNVLGLAPDLYLRDFVGDTGVPHTGPISASPDIILRPTAVADPQASFGAGSGTENNSTLGFTAEAGQDNFIYARVLNQGGGAAVNATVTVYWSPVATLVSPDLWTLIGTATLPNVPTGEVLTAAPGITWPAAGIPGPGHYCFVGVVGHPGDPAPSPGALLNWTNFNNFIRNNNNITWRNFNVEDNDPAPDPGTPKGFVAMPFLAPGAFDRARPMQLEIIARLPDQAKLFWEVPQAFLDLLPERYPHVQIDPKTKVARIPVRPSGQIRAAGSPAAGQIAHGHASAGVDSGGTQEEPLSAGGPSDVGTAGNGPRDMGARTQRPQEAQGLGLLAHERLDDRRHPIPFGPGRRELPAARSCSRWRSDRHSR